MSRDLDVHTEVEKAPLSLRHWIMVLLLGAVTLFDGYGVFVAGSTIPFVMRVWHLKPSQAGLMVSFGLIGFMVGSLAGGPIADRIGRKPTLVGGLLLAGLFSMATAAWGNSYASFLLFRLLTGAGLGMLLPLAVTMINETAPRRTANLLVGCVMVGWSGGGVLAALAGGVLGQRFGWPAMYWIAGAGAPMALLAWGTLMESPRFLTIHDRQPEARAVMSALAPGAAYGDDVRFISHEDTRRRGSILRLLEPATRRATLVVWLCAGFSLFVIFGLSSWLPQAMTVRGESFGSSFGFAALLQFMAILGGVGCGWIADRVDRRIVLIASWLIGAAAITGMALVNLHWANIAFISIAGFMIMGAQPVLNNFTASLYETEVRSTGVGVQLGVGRLGGILGPYILGWLQQIYGGAGPMFAAMGAAAALSALCLGVLGHRGPSSHGPATRIREDA